MSEIEVILTHEHTDFDALASLFAASLLFPDALPLLPARLNRNVRHFLALYRNHFRFLPPAEAPRGRVARAIFVDTRSANWPRGMDRKTEVLVIDHHAQEEPAPEGWQVISEPVGANTTLLVEKLMERNIALSPVQLTLLALGIHEDTGSLTYAGSTDRDARCLAWLLAKRGVNFTVLNNFLSHPLSEAQRDLLQTLIDRSEFLEIAGHTVVIAQANAPHYKEEISALAGRLRDYHETDAVFLIIGLEDVVQVVARSTTDEIDVGAVARDLGGGGHTRAAAAPVHDKSLSTTAVVRDRIVELVARHSRSAITVRQLMSAGRPQSLSPDMTVDQAIALMQRYGHEGFPVIAARTGREELIGVLTRREADRAVSHGLGGEPVRRFMRAGQVVVHPDDSFSTLRKRMIESNWGQIPVVDDEGAIIGIVTRTDLIKLWDQAELPESRAPEIAARLRSKLTPLQHFLLDLVGRRAEEMDYTVYVVGGFVRDLLLDRPDSRVAAFDMDIVIEGDAIELAYRMQALYGGRIVPHKRFGTAKWLLAEGEQPVDRAGLFGLQEEELRAWPLPPHLDFITARTEFYTEPTALPTVESSSIKLDLHRRDFTINTLALCLNPDRWGELFDFWGGMADLRNGVVRVLHSLSFVDDPTRILRAVRYEQRFGFEIEPRTLELLLDALDLLERVTPARVRHELDRIFQEAEPERALFRLQELGVLARIHPALTFDGWTAERFARLRVALAAPRPDARLAAEAIERLYWAILTYQTPSDVDAELVERLGLRRATQRLVHGLEKWKESAATLARPGVRPSEVVALLDRIDPTALAVAAVICAGEPAAARLAAFEQEWRSLRPELDGADLKRMGVARGELYGRILAALRAGRLDGEIASRAEEEALVRRMVAEEWSPNIPGASRPP